MLLFLILRFFAPFITILRCVLSYCFTRLNERIKSINWTLLISVKSFLNHIILDKINQLKLMKKNIGICLYILEISGLLFTVQYIHTKHKTERNPRVFRDVLSNRFHRSLDTVDRYTSSTR